MLKKNSMLAALLSAALLFSMMPASALAAEEASSALDEAALSASNTSEKTETTSEGDGLAEDTVLTLPTAILGFEEGQEETDDLFAQYVRRQFLGETDMASSYMPANEETISGLNKLAYEKVAEAWKEVSDGDRAETTVRLSLADLGITKTTYSSADLGGVEIVANSSVTSESEQKFFELYCPLDFSLIARYLRAGCAYEYYWSGTSIRWGYGGISASGYGSVWDLDVSDFYVIFYADVNANYQPSGYDSENPTVDTAAIKDTNSRVFKAVANANTIVSAAADKSDYEKLCYYKQQLCDMITYNTAAAQTANYADKDAWALIYALDGDPDTNVVCEGYSEAFQYLCEMSSFSNASTRAYSVTGTMNDGGHKWNIVRIGGSNYIADITNSDSGSIGQDGGLFLSGVSGSYSDYYYVTIYGSTIKYVYDSETKAVYTEEELTLSAADYVDSGEESGSEEPTASITGISICLTDLIGLNVTVTSTEPLGDGDKMVFTYAGETVEMPASKASVDGSVYTFTLPLYAKQMTEDVSFYLVASGQSSDTQTWSVRDYAKEIMSGNYDEAAKDLVTAMLRYGACSQTYLNYKANDLADSDLTDAAQTAAPDLTAYAYTLDKAADTKGFHLTSATLCLDAAIALKFYYTKDEADAAYAFEVLENETTLADTRITNEYDASEGSGCLVVTGIQPDHLDSFFTLTVKSEDDVVTTIKYSPLSYCNSKLQLSSSEDTLKALCTAIYNYCDKAKAYTALA